jgi:hypothetical protein
MPWTLLGWKRYFEFHYWLFAFQLIKIIKIITVVVFFEAKINYMIFDFFNCIIHFGICSFVCPFL